VTVDEQQQVLKMVYDGIISAGAANRLLEALGSPPDDGRAHPPSGTRAAALGAGPARLAPLIAGSLVTGLGALGLAAAYVWGSAAWRVAGYLTLSLGLLLTLGGLWLARATWLHIRIARASGSRAQLNLQLPLPLPLAAWAVRLARTHLREFDMTGLDEAILALRDGIHSGQAIQIDVLSDDGTERIQITVA
jgi:hypothetical protein